MDQVLGQLERLRRRTRALLLLQRCSVMAAWILGACFALVLLDYALRLPSGLRLVALVAGLAAVGAGVVRYLTAAIVYRPTLTQLALRVERSMPAVAGRLASSVEFVLAGVDRENPLAARSVREAQRRLAGDALGRCVRPGRTLRDVAICLGVVAVVVTGAVASPPGAASTGLKRLLLPYGSAEWPARTAVASLMGEVLARPGIHPRGQALPLRARNLTNGAPGDRVDAYYRVRQDGEWDDWRAVVLTHQGGGVHERLVDTNAETLEVYFATEDAATKVEPIRLVPPPAIVRATLTVEPPAYARGRVATLDASLGPGLDERAVTERASLVGSRAELVLELNKPLPGPPSGAMEAWIRRTFGWSGDDASALPRFRAETPNDTGASDRWRLAWTLRGTRTIALALEDEHGLGNREPISYRVEAIEDHPPSATITEPPSDVSVLPTAVVSLAAEAKDDVAVVRLAFDAGVERGGAVAEAIAFGPARAADAETAGLEAAIDLSSFDLSEGDVVLVTALAEDDFELDGARHEPTASSVRRLRIISELDLAAMLRRQLSAVRQNAIRMESQQSELQDDVVEHGPQPGVKAAQAQIGDRIATQRDAIEELREALDRNRLDDPQLTELIQQSGDLLDYAGRGANRAVEAIETRETAAPAGEDAADRAPRAGAPDGAPDADPDEDPDADPDADPDEDETLRPRAPAPVDREIVDAQQDVRDELSDLIELLDRDEDTWIVQRQLESLIDEQAGLEQETAGLARETMGQPLENLTEPQLSELDRIVQRQRELREEARRLIEEMRRRASALEELDPPAASGMRTAAETGEEREVDRDMENAADRAAQNQLETSAAAQRSAGASLQRMLEDLEETRRASAQELLRQLASLQESIDRLIVVQENELIALAQAQAEGVYTGRDRAMIRLNQNTRSVAAEARAAGQATRRVARTLDRAADAQGAAITALRARPPGAGAAKEGEDRSLALLKEARRLAEELREETEQEQMQQAREELIAAYRALAEKQIAVRTETLGLAIDGEPTRRQLVEARRIGHGQEEIRTGLADVRDQTREILDSEIFSLVHELMDEWARLASEALWDGRVDVDVTDRQQMIADSIARQIEAIEESATPPGDFDEERQAQGAGGGGASPPALIPPVAEVKRLHGLQEQVYDQTRSIDGREDLTPGQRRRRVRDLGGMQRELIRIGEGMLERMSGGRGGGDGGSETGETGEPEAE